MIVDTAPDRIVVRDAEAVLGTISDVHLNPAQARALADKLDAAGEHTVAAAGLRGAADRAEKLAQPQ